MYTLAVFARFVDADRPKRPRAVCIICGCRAKSCTSGDTTRVTQQLGKLQKLKMIIKISLGVYFAEPTLSC